MEVAITLLLEFLKKYVKQCGDLILVKTNIGAFSRYIKKDCYPSGLCRNSYRNSVEIHRLLAVPTTDAEEDKRAIHPRQLKGWFIL